MQIAFSNKVHLYIYNTSTLHVQKIGIYDLVDDDDAMRIFERLVFSSITF